METNNIFSTAVNQHRPSTHETKALTVQEKTMYSSPMVATLFSLKTKSSTKTKIVNL